MQSFLYAFIEVSPEIKINKQWRLKLQDDERDLKRRGLLEDSSQKEDWVV